MDKHTRDELYMLILIAQARDLTRAVRWIMARLTEESQQPKRRRKRGIRVTLARTGTPAVIDADILAQALTTPEGRRGNGR